jgi:TatD DNase family protein
MEIKFIDTHCHVQFPIYSNPQSVIDRALQAGIAVINIGTQLDTSKWAVDIASKNSEGVYAVVGLHPNHTYDNNFEDVSETYAHRIEENFDIESYRELARSPKVVGIGECGLDYYRFPEGVDVEAIKLQQKTAFHSQIQLAIELNKALVIHCRPSKDTNNAYEDLLAILEDYKGHLKNTDSELRFEIHSFTGDVDIAQRVIELGGLLGLNGIITFDKTGRSERVVKVVPLEHILLETDAPYLAPAPNRGKQNEPAWVIHIAEKIAEWKDRSINEVAAVTTANAQKLFTI